VVLRLQSGTSSFDEVGIVMKTAIVIGVFAVVVLVFFYDVIIGPNVYLDANPFHYDPWRSYASEGDLAHKTYRTDSFVTYLPRRVELTESIRSGRFPLWNPYVFGGMPFFADPQTRVLYPIALLLIPADPLKSMGYDIAIHVFLAMLGMYLFMRQVGVRTLGGVAAAFGYAFSSFYYVRMGHPTFVAAGAWIPFFFYGFECARNRERKGTLLLTLFFAMGYLAGFPQVFLFGVGAVVLYGLYVSACVVGNRRQSILRTARVFIISGGLAVLIVAVQLVPFAELARNSIGLSIDFEHMRDIFLTPPVILLRTIFPNFFGNPVDGTDWADLPRETVHPYNPDFAVYCGIGVLLLAAYSSLFARKSPRIRLLLLLLLLSVGIATISPLLRIGHALLPLFRASRISRVAVLSCFALSSLAGIGFSKIPTTSGSHLRKKLLHIAVVIVTIGLATAIVFQIVGESAIEGLAVKARSVPESMWAKIHSYTRSGKIKEWAEGDTASWIVYQRRQIFTGILIILVASALLIIMASPGAIKSKHRMAASVSLVVFILFDIGLTAKSYYISQLPDSLFETRGIRVLKDGLREHGKWRILVAHHEDQSVLVLPTNTNQIFRLHSLPGTSTIIPGGYSDLEGEFMEFELPGSLWLRHSPFSPSDMVTADLGSVRYILVSTYKTMYLPSPFFNLVGGLEGTAQNLRMLTVGGDTRLAVCQSEGRALNVRANLPAVNLLDVSLGFNSNAKAPGDTVVFMLTCESGQTSVGLLKRLDLYTDRGRWHPLRLDISKVKESIVHMRIGWKKVKSGRTTAITAGWSGLDLVYRDCAVLKLGDAYVIDVGDGAESVKLTLASDAEEIPLEIQFDENHKRIYWVGFPAHMPSREVTVDVRQRTGSGILVRSDSTFTLTRSRVVYSGKAYQNYDLVYDSDMYIYENFGAIEKGILLDNEAVGIEGEGPEQRLNISELYEGLADAKCGVCRITSYEPEAVSFEVTAARDCYLLFQDVWYPGWKAYVDDKETEILRTDIGMRAIELGEGGHDIVMKYQPRSLKIGLGLSCLGLALTLAYAWLTRRSEAASS
jgi:hypothetical protein